MTSGPAFAALDDFTLATPSLEDVYLALGRPGGRPGEGVSNVPACGTARRGAGRDDGVAGQP